MVNGILYDGVKGFISTTSLGKDLHVHSPDFMISSCCDLPYLLEALSGMLVCLALLHCSGAIVLCWGFV